MSIFLSEKEIRRSQPDYDKATESHVQQASRAAFLHSYGWRPGTPEPTQGRSTMSYGYTKPEERANEAGLHAGMEARYLRNYDREQFENSYPGRANEAMRAGMKGDWKPMAQLDQDTGKMAPYALSEQRVASAKAFLDGKLSQRDYINSALTDTRKRVGQREQENSQKLSQGVDGKALARIGPIPAQSARDAHDLSRREQQRTPTSGAHSKAQQNLHAAAEKNTAAEKSFMQTAKEYGAKKLSDLVTKPAAEQVRGIKAWGEAFVSRANLVAAGKQIERVATQAKDFCREIAQSAREAVGGVKSADLEKTVSKMDLGRDQQTRDQAKASVAAGPAFDKKSLQEKRACVALQGASNDADMAAKSLATGMKELGIEKLSDAKRLDGAGKEKLAGMLNEYNTAHRHLGKCAEKVADVRQNEARQVQQKEAGKERAAGAQQQLGSFMRQRQEAQAKAKEHEQGQGQAKKPQEEQQQAQQARPQQKKADERVLGG